MEALRLDVVHRLTQTLATCETIMTDGGLRLLVSYVQASVGLLSLRRYDVPKLALVDLLRLCGQTPGGFPALGAAVRIVADEATALQAAGCVAELDGLAALSTELTGDDWQILRTYLASAPLPDADAVAYALTEGRYVPQWPEPDTMWALFLRLAPSNTPAEEPPPWLSLIRLAAARLGGTAETELGELIARAVRRWDPDDPDGLGSLGGAQLPQRPTPAPATGSPVRRPTAHLMILLEPVAAHPDRLIVATWRQWELGPWRPVYGGAEEIAAADLERTIERLVFDMEGRWDRAEGSAQWLAIEFVLSNDLFGLAVEQIPLESSSIQPVPLGLAYPVSIRSLHRLRQRHWSRSWDNRWELVKRQSPNGRRPRAHHSVWRGLDPTGSHLRDLDRELHRDDVVCLVLSSPVAGPGSRGGQEAELALRVGCPILLWHRSDCSSPQFQQLVEALLDGADFYTLPWRIHDLRCNGDGDMLPGARPVMERGSSPESGEAPGTPDVPSENWQDKSAGYGLVLLWDDAHRRPDVPAG